MGDQAGDVAEWLARRRRLAQRFAKVAQARFEQRLLAGIMRVESRPADIGRVADVLNADLIPGAPPGQ